MNDEKLTKVCKVCGSEYPIEYFNKSSNGIGHVSVCKNCDKRNNRSGIPELNVRGLENSPLKNFTPRQLIDELHARGYRGTLTLYVKHDIIV